MLKAISLLFLGFQMSLYIGKLSPRTRKDELEHIFWRFGRCEVQQKDGYGFVVYKLEHIS